MTKAQGSIYQLKVALKYLRPAVWRRIEVRADTQLAKLHRILQAAMGWNDSHLHQFIVGTTYYGIPSGDDFLDADTQDERKVTLNRILSRPGEKVVYEYDFGDGWEHEILLERIVAAQSGERYPRCVAGARACPPDDCGGAAGYEDLLAAIRDSGHPDHEELLDWVGGSFDPQAFDLKAVDAQLRRVR